jgi:hypothetical protein
MPPNAEQRCRQYGRHENFLHNLSPFDCLKQYANGADQVSVTIWRKRENVNKEGLSALILK